MPIADFLSALEGSVPAYAEALAEFRGPLPAACDERFDSICAAYRGLTPDERCECASRFTAEARDWLRAEAQRVAMLSVRQQSRAAIENALLGLFLGHESVTREPIEINGYLGLLAVCRRCVQLLELDPVVFEEQLAYICESATLTRVRAFLNSDAGDQVPQRWGFYELTGDHGVIFLWGKAPAPAAWL